MLCHLKGRLSPRLLFMPQSVNGRLRFYCQTCPYVFEVKDRVVVEVPLEHKTVDDVLGGPEAWKNADQSDGACVRPSASQSSHSANPLTAHVLPAPQLIAPSVQTGEHIISSERQPNSARSIPASAHSLCSRHAAQTTNTFCR